MGDVEQIKSSVAYPRKTDRKGSDLGVEHDGAENTGGFHGGSEIVESLLMVFVGPMREVEAGDVHSGHEQLLYHRHRPRCRSQGAHDLRLRLLIHL